MSVIYAPGDHMFGLARQGPPLAPLRPCQICGCPDDHHGFGRSCYGCPGGRCQPRVVKPGAQQARPGR